MKISMLAVVFAATNATAQPTKRVDVTDQVLNMKSSSYLIPSKLGIRWRRNAGEQLRIGGDALLARFEPGRSLGCETASAHGLGWSSRPIAGLPTTPDGALTLRRVKFRPLRRC